MCENFDSYCKIFHGIIIVTVTSRFSLIVLILLYTKDRLEAAAKKVINK